MGIGELTLEALALEGCPLASSPLPTTKSRPGPGSSLILSELFALLPLPVFAPAPILQVTAFQGGLDLGVLRGQPAYQLLGMG